MKTATVMKSLSPEWDETFVLPFTRRTRFAVVECWDYDRFSTGRGDFLGPARQIPKSPNPPH